MVFFVVLKILVVLFMVGFGWYFTSFFRDKRTNEMAQIARDLQLHFRRKHHRLRLQYKDFLFFQHGRRRRIFNCITGTRQGFTLAVGDFHYEERATRVSDPVSDFATFIIVQADMAVLPHFSIDSNHRLTSLWRKVSGESTIVFDNDVFSDVFVVRSKEEERVRKLLCPKVRQQLLQHKDDMRCFEASGSTLLFYWGNRAFLLPPEKVPAYVDRVCALMRALMDGSQE